MHTENANSLRTLHTGCTCCALLALLCMLMLMEVCLLSAGMYRLLSPVISVAGNMPSWICIHILLGLTFTRRRSHAGCIGSAS